MALPSNARKALQYWIAHKALNPVVKAEYSLPSLDESDVQLVRMWGRPIQKNLDEQSIIEQNAKTGTMVVALRKIGRKGLCEFL